MPSVTRDIKVSASLMCADLGCLREQVQILMEEGIDMFHCDIMDGHFVPNLALSPDIIRAVKLRSKGIFDAHLMVTNPKMYVNELFNIGVECITLHIETLGSNAFRLIEEIRNHGTQVGLALNPATPITFLEYFFDLVDKITVMTVDPGFAGQKFITPMLRKIQMLHLLRQNNNYAFKIEVDGSINEKTFKDVINAGADILVVGTSGLFGLDKDLRKAVHKMRMLLLEALQSLSNSSRMGVNKLSYGADNG